MSNFQWYTLVILNSSVLIVQIIGLWQRHIQVRHTKRKEKYWDEKYGGE